MARHEEDREDLLREATALWPRGELRVPGFEDTVVIGFRGRAASVYFGADPALHFTSDNHLRRGYVDGLLLKANQGRLVQMQRVRTGQEVQLRSRPLTPEEQQAMLARVAQLLTSLRNKLAANHYELVGQVPEDGDIVAVATEWLAQIVAADLSVAERPNMS